MSQNRKSSGSYNHCGSSLFRHRPDARVALQPPTGTPKTPQSPILQGDMDKLREMNYNGKRKGKPLRPFTQLLEHTLSEPSLLSPVLLYPSKEYPLVGSIQ